MAANDERDAEIHRIVAADPPELDADDGDDDEVVIDTYEPVPRFVFVGLARPEDRRGNPLRDVNGRRFPPAPRAVDGRGVSVASPELDVLRWCMQAEAEGDYEAAERVRADWANQLAKAGVWHRNWLKERVVRTSAGYRYNT